MTTMNDQIERDISKVFQKLDQMQLAQSQQKLLEYSSNVNRLWMAYIKFVKSRGPSSTNGPTEFWEKRLDLFCTSPSLDPIAMLEAISSEILGCAPQGLALQVPDDVFVPWRISVIKIMEQVQYVTIQKSRK